MVNLHVNGSTIGPALHVIIIHGAGAVTLYRGSKSDPGNCLYKNNSESL